MLAYYVLYEVETSKYHHKGRKNKNDLLLPRNHIGSNKKAL